MSVEQAAVARPMPDSVHLNINHLLKHLCFVPKAKGVPKRKERRVCYINNLFVPQTVVERPR